MDQNPSESLGNPQWLNYPENSQFAMNRDPEAKIEALFTWLLNPPVDDSSSDSEEVISNSNPSEDSSRWMDRPDESSGDWEALDPLESEDIDGIYPPHLNSQGQPLEIGEIPAVQDRFQALLKRRIQAEMQSSLPLFPWETTVMDYEDDPCEVTSSAPVLSQPWILQLKQLNFPVPVELPESLLSQLLDRCQKVAQSTLQEGAKLVQAVENLFPNEILTLNKFATPLVLGEMRSGALSASPIGDQPAESRQPLVYEEAQRSQKMRISLLAAQQILQTLTLNPVVNQAVAQRDWETELGLLQVGANYIQGEKGSQLQVEVLLPCAGSVEIQGEEGQAIAKRYDRGYVSVELFDIAILRPYSLVIELENNSEAPLMFTIRPTHTRS